MFERGKWHSSIQSVCQALTKAEDFLTTEIPVPDLWKVLLVAVERIFSTVTVLETIGSLE